VHFKELLQWITTESMLAVPRISQEGEFFIDNLLVRVHFIIVMIGWTGLAHL